MRALNKGWIGIALVILFGASLFFFRGSSRYSNLFNSDNFVANISGTPISTTQFIRSLEMNIGQFSQMIGEELSGDQIRSFQIHQLVLQNLVNNAIFENEFDDLKYILDDSVIAKKTKERFPNLYLNNKINDDVLNDFLKSQRLKIDDLVNIINYETRSEVFDELIFKKNYPSAFSKKIQLFNDQTRSIDIFEIPYDEINLINFAENNITKNNKELINYFEENKNNYMNQESRDISYILINKEFFKNNFIPSSNEIESYFNENKKMFIIPEKRTFKQFNFKTKNEAEKFKNDTSGFEIDKIISFAEKNEIQFNQFENVSKNQVLDELSNVIFTLSVNNVSNVISTTLAHHIVVLDEITIKRDRSLEEVFEEIKQILTDVQLDNFFNDLKLNINQQILDGLSMSEIAQKNKLNIEKISKAQLNSEKDSLINQIINTGFSQNKDFISDIIEYDPDRSFILNVDNVFPSTFKEIDIVLNDVKSDFIKFKKYNFANEIYENIKDSNELNKISEVFDTKPEQINIKIMSSDLNPSFLTEIFNANLGEVIFYSDENNIYFAKSNEIQIPKETQILKDIKLLSELKNAFGNEIIKTKNISINNELINGLLSQYK